MSKAAIYARTPAQQQQLRESFRQRLATYRRPAPNGGGWGTPERSIAHFRCEYEHMPLIEFWQCIRLPDTGNYHVLLQSGPKRNYETPTLLGRDVLPAARIWREERDRWVQQWLAEAQQLYGLTTLPAAEGTENNVYGHKVPGIPANWLLATHEWPEMDWSRETPGVFEVYEHDLDELRRLPHNLDGVGSCEPEEFEVMDERKLPDLAALSRVILALYDAYGEDSALTKLREVRKDGEWYSIISFDCRSWLKVEVEQAGPPAAPTYPQFLYHPKLRTWLRYNSATYFCLVSESQLQVRRERPQELFKPDEVQVVSEAAFLEAYRHTSRLLRERAEQHLATYQRRGSAGNEWFYCNLLYAGGNAKLERHLRLNVSVDEHGRNWQLLYDYDRHWHDARRVASTEQEFAQQLQALLQEAEAAATGQEGGPAT